MDSNNAASYTPSQALVNTVPGKMIITTTPRVVVSSKSMKQHEMLTTTPAVGMQHKNNNNSPQLVQPSDTMLSEPNEQVPNYIKEKTSMTNMNPNTKNDTINYKNGKKVEPVLLSYNNYFLHREKLPEHYHPLVQYLEKTELKYHNDNLYENSPIGFPTRAQILREKVYHLPIIKSTPADKAKYKRKMGERQAKMIDARKKYDFKTYENYSSHYFLTGGRYNRNDTIDSKVLNKYGIFVNRHNPESVYIKSTERAVKNYYDDIHQMNTFAALQNRGLFEVLTLNFFFDASQSLSNNYFL
jgi:hypothetical protein